MNPTGRHRRPRGRSSTRSRFIIVAPQPPTVGSTGHFEIAFAAASVLAAAPTRAGPSRARTQAGQPGTQDYCSCVADDDCTLRVEREDGELLVLDGLALARAFFTGDISARPGGYDALAGQGDSNLISVEDVNVMNRSMRARSDHARWVPVFESDQAWLRAIPVDLDLIETDEAAWEAAGGDELLSAAIAACIRPYIALARSTKVLHLKRPLLVPLLDELVVQVMGVNLPGSPSREQRIAIAQGVAAAIRREGRRNLDVLRRIQDELAAADHIRRPLVRIFDAILWFSHPATAVFDVRREITVRLRD